MLLEIDGRERYSFPNDEGEQEDLEPREFGEIKNYRLVAITERGEQTLYYRIRLHRFKEAYIVLC